MYRNLNAEQARKGMTNQEVSERLGISRTSYEKKKKTGKFVVREVVALCKLFGCGFEYLFENSDLNNNVA